MAYDPTKPPSLVTQDIGNRGQATWTYSTTDAPAVVDTAGYISNMDALGMKVGDVVQVTFMPSGLVNNHYVDSVTKNGAGDLRDATAFAAITDTD